MLPSPIQATVAPLMAPFFSSKVITSAMTWQGWERTVEPVDHRHGGVRGKLEQRLVRSGAQHDRIDIARQHARGIGDGLAPPQLHVVALSMIELPPSSRMATSKETRVRVEGFSKIMASRRRPDASRLSGRRGGPWPSSHEPRRGSRAASGVQRVNIEKMLRRHGGSLRLVGVRLADERRCRGSRRRHRAWRRQGRSRLRR